MHSGLDRPVEETGGSGEQAERKGVKIVPMCGYESMPSDLLTLYAVEHIKKKYGK